MHQKILNMEEVVKSEVRIIGKDRHRIAFIVTCTWLYPMIVNTILLLIQNETLKKYVIVLLKDVHDCELDIHKDLLSGPLCLHFYGLESNTINNHRFDELSGYTKARFNNCLQSTYCETVILTNQSDSVFLSRKLIPQIKSLDVGLIHKPASWYGLSFQAPEVNSKIVFLQKDNNYICLFFDFNPGHEFILPFELVPTRTYCIRMITIKIQNDMSTNSNVCVCDDIKFSNLIKFKAYLTSREYSLLYKMAIDYESTRNKGTHPIKYLYRNKPSPYFEWIFSRYNGKMRPYIKDKNGDPCSIINGNIYGLFFSTYHDLKTYHPPLESFFGEVRLNVNAEELFRPNCNLYFADFYCHYHVHYVTLVLTQIHSPADQFCQGRLIILDIFDNPFMFLHRTGNLWQVMANHNIRIEVFYTEEIDIPKILQHNLGFMNKVVPLGRGSSKLFGIPKNKECSMCNIKSEEQGVFHV